MDEKVKELEKRAVDHYKDSPLEMGDGICVVVLEELDGAFEDMKKGCSRMSTIRRLKAIHKLVERHITECFEDEVRAAARDAYNQEVAQGLRAAGY